jgi:hypothetical protein
MGDVRTFSLEAEVEELFRAKMKEFSEWAAENWTMTEAEAQTLTEPTAVPSEYAKGYTAAMTDGLRDALDLWMGEYWNG